MLLQIYSLLLVWSSIVTGTSFWTAFLPVAVCRARDSSAETSFASQRGWKSFSCYPDDFDVATESKFMERALELAAKGSGKTRPNPAVGCVVLDSKGKMVGEGFHPKAGEPHAEVFALAQAGERAEGGTAYVTLEPCNHHGRTPPCVDALLRAKVKRVVAGMVDPDPRTAGNGLKRLAANGVEVVELPKDTELGKSCHHLNMAFSHRILTGTVYGSVHCGLSKAGISQTKGVLLCHHPDFNECDGILVEGNEGVELLEQCEKRNLLPDSVVRVIVADCDNLDLEACTTWMKRGAEYIILCKQGEMNQSTLMKWQQESFITVQLDDLSIQEISSHFYHFGFLSMIWAVSPTRTQEVISLGFAQKVHIHLDESPGQAITDERKIEISKLISWLVGSKFNLDPKNLDFHSIGSSVVLQLPSSHPQNTPIIRSR
mmetsp:Transcript_33960/g.44810  ORF Transcript_33960/g.44810 Transcript_33960/m.44810 type:complete len:430 (-) Transcript_33960:176-1465(-)|eukprot:CAMPEP_0117757522 /NCGR_PEP_ID=MMETSP0947-20121206/14788_1 /TAXON_ID=44440 /ORGANISM="Chattonella subsalsa, Strain CCMP2191" /LENGTH=429 /DNA_ID=CAMNT_0005577445 /DNA_START=106 /DNA_END=1395 /DNA_ORIENTATION=-